MRRNRLRIRPQKLRYQRFIPYAGWTILSSVIIFVMLLAANIYVPVDWSRQAMMLLLVLAALYFICSRPAILQASCFPDSLGTWRLVILPVSFPQLFLLCSAAFFRGTRSYDRHCNPTVCDHRNHYRLYICVPFRRETVDATTDEVREEHGLTALPRNPLPGN